MNELIIFKNSKGIHYRITWDEKLPDIGDAEFRLVKVPEPLYQDFFTLANYLEKDVARKMIFKKLQEWVEEKYPEFGIISLQDFDTKQADKITEQMKDKHPNIRVQWGMYLLLFRGTDYSLVEVIKETAFLTKIITDGQRINHQNPPSVRR